jgi:ABC-2 type transport system ATP-binding protein
MTASSRSGGGRGLEARGLSKRYASVAVVRAVDAVVRPGEVIGYLGPNGSGKTTTVRMITGLIEPSEGSVLHDGRSIFGDLVAFRRRLGYVPEEAHLYPFLSGREYLELVGRLRELPVALLERKINSLLELFGILSAADQPLSGYSKGMKQKVLISAALLHDPDLLILDEPESGLDVTAVLVLRSLITELARRGKAILYSSHIMESVERVCARVVVLHRGEVVADDSSSRLRALMARDSLEAVFAQLVVQDNPDRTASDIADVAALRA